MRLPSKRLRDSDCCCCLVHDHFFSFIVFFLLSRHSVAIFIVRLFCFRIELAYVFLSYIFVNWPRNLVSIVYRLCVFCFLLFLSFFQIVFLLRPPSLFLRLVCYLKFCLVLIFFFGPYLGIAEHTFAKCHIFLTIVVVVVVIVRFEFFALLCFLILDRFRAFHTCMRVRKKFTKRKLLFYFQFYSFLLFLLLGFSCLFVPFETKNL